MHFIEIFKELIVSDFCKYCAHPVIENIEYNYVQDLSRADTR